ncbi:MAG TPA: alpha/beta hydrolase [Puia sp.]|jgi:predicted alpha/beta hydrolase family esterase|nr:alpha/beta hydrolase [Puia sp.]
MSDTFCFILPGLNSSGPRHWQSRWEELYGFIRIHQRDWDTPVCEDWIRTVDEVIAPFPPAKVILIGHSLGCCTIAHWAEKYRRSIKGAFLVAPSDVESPNYPPGTDGFDPMPLSPLPFPSMVITSANDEFVSPERAAFFAGKWESAFTNIGRKGHINAVSGLGDWDEGYELLKELY